MLIIFQILFILFALFAVVNVLKKKHEGLLGPKGAIFWLLFWLLAAVAVMLPSGITELANTFGIGRGADFVLYVAMVIIFYLLFRLNVKMESIGRDITKVVRKEAIEENRGIKR